MTQAKKSKVFRKVNEKDINFLHISKFYENAFYDKEFPLVYISLNKDYKDGCIELTSEKSQEYRSIVKNRNREYVPIVLYLDYLVNGFPYSNIEESLVDDNFYEDSKVALFSEDSKKYKNPTDSIETINSEGYTLNAKQSIENSRYHFVPHYDQYLTYYEKQFFTKETLELKNNIPNIDIEFNFDPSTIESYEYTHTSIHNYETYENIYNYLINRINKKDSNDNYLHRVGAVLGMESDYGLESFLGYSRGYSMNIVFPSYRKILDSTFINIELTIKMENDEEQCNPLIPKGLMVENSSDIAKGYNYYGYEIINKIRNIKDENKDASSDDENEDEQAVDSSFNMTSIENATVISDPFPEIDDINEFETINNHVIYDDIYITDKTMAGIKGNEVEEFIYGTAHDINRKERSRFIMAPFLETLDFLHQNTTSVIKADVGTTYQKVQSYSSFKDIVGEVSKESIEKFFSDNYDEDNNFRIFPMVLYAIDDAESNINVKNAHEKTRGHKIDLENRNFICNTHIKIINDNIQYDVYIGEVENENHIIVNEVALEHNVQDVIDFTFYIDLSTVENTRPSYFNNRKYYEDFDSILSGKDNHSFNYRHLNKICISKYMTEFDYVLADYLMRYSKRLNMVDLNHFGKIYNTIKKSYHLHNDMTLKPLSNSVNYKVLNSNENNNSEKYNNFINMDLGDITELTFSGDENKEYRYHILEEHVLCYRGDTINIPKDTFKTMIFDTLYKNIIDDSEDSFWENIEMIECKKELSYPFKKFYTSEDSLNSASKFFLLNRSRGGKIDKTFYFSNIINRKSPFRNVDLVFSYKNRYINVMNFSHFVSKFIPFMKIVLGSERIDVIDLHTIKGISLDNNDLKDIVFENIVDIYLEYHDKSKELYNELRNKSKSNDDIYSMLYYFFTNLNVIHNIHAYQYNTNLFPINSIKDYFNIESDRIFNTFDNPLIVMNLLMKLVTEECFSLIKDRLFPISEYSYNIYPYYEKYDQSDYNYTIRNYYDNDICSIRRSFNELLKPIIREEYITQDVYDSLDTMILNYNDFMSRETYPLSYRNIKAGSKKRELIDKNNIPRNIHFVDDIEKDKLTDEELNDLKMALSYYFYQACSIDRLSKVLNNTINALPIGISFNHKESLEDFFGESVIKENDSVVTYTEVLNFYEPIRKKIEPIKKKYFNLYSFLNLKGPLSFEDEQCVVKHLFIPTYYHNDKNSIRGHFDDDLSIIHETLFFEDFFFHIQRNNIVNFLYGASEIIFEDDDIIMYSMDSFENTDDFIFNIMPKNFHHESDITSKYDMNRSITIQFIMNSVIDKDEEFGLYIYKETDDKNKKLIVHEMLDMVKTYSKSYIDGLDRVKNKIETLKRHNQNMITHDNLRYYFKELHKVGSPSVLNSDNFRFRFSNTSDLFSKSVHNINECSYLTAEELIYKMHDSEKSISKLEIFPCSNGVIDEDSEILSSLLKLSVFRKMFHVECNSERNFIDHFIPKNDARRMDIINYIIEKSGNDFFIKDSIRNTNNLLSNTKIINLFENSFSINSNNRLNDKLSNVKINHTIDDIKTNFFERPIINRFFQNNNKKDESRISARLYKSIEISLLSFFLEKENEDYIHETLYLRKRCDDIFTALESQYASENGINEKDK